MSATRARLAVLTAVLLLVARPVAAQEQYFTDETSGMLPEVLDVCVDAEFGDVDGDGYLDLFLSEPAPTGVPNQLWMNARGDSFTNATAERLPGGGYRNTSDGDFGDVDGDGDLDLFVSNWDDRSQVLINDGSGFFTDDPSRLPDLYATRYSRDGDFGDIDGDLDLDVLVATFNTQYELLFINDGNGFFEASLHARFPSGTQNTTHVDFGDVDGDLDLDAIVANTLGQINRLMINDGTGWFVDETSQRIPRDDSQSNDVEFGDIDGDGDLDIGVANGFFATCRIWINDGGGYYRDETVGRIPLDSDASGEIDFGDVDNDGDLDIIIANSAQGGQSTRLYINDGSGVFSDETAARFPSVEEEDADVQFGDVDNDGDLDILIADFLAPVEGEQNRLLINHSTPDSFPPVIPRTFHHPDTADTSQPYLITTTVWDNIGVAVGDLQVSFFYATRGDTAPDPGRGEFTEIAMKNSGGFLYRERIPAQPTGTRVDYYVRARDRMGNVALDPSSAPDSVFSFVVDVTLGIGDGPNPGANLPRAFSLSQNYPNPFNPSTTIDYEIPAPAAAGAGSRAGRGGTAGSGGGGGGGWLSGSSAAGGTVPVDLRIYDLRGRLVRTLVDGERPPGRHSVHWDGRDERGEPVSSGVYLYRLEAGDFVSTRKMVIAR